MSSQVELCEHHAKDCLQAAEKTEDPLGARDASQACAGVAAGRACSIQAIEAVSCLWTQGSTGIEPGTLSHLRAFAATVANPTAGFNGPTSPDNGGMPDETRLLQDLAKPFSPLC